jgi:DNA-binding response OmpR family regulator
MIKPKILIAEDELLISKVLKIILEKNNYTVFQVMDADSAVAAAKELCPDLIILDIYLKNNSSGIEAGETIRKNGYKGPIVFTTGNAYQQTKDELQKIENHHLFIKPVDVDVLLKHINSKFLMGLPI